MKYYTSDVQGTPPPQPSSPPSGGFRRAFPHDLMSSIVTFLVALPLCMGIAIASGIPKEQAAATGILTGIIAGLVIGWIAGSPLQVSGPAAGLSVLIFELIMNARESFLNARPDLASLDEAGQALLQGQATQHALAVLGIVVLFAGIMQLAAGLLGWGRWFRAVSPSVIQGMLAGIGILILGSQFHVMIDADAPGKGLANLLAIPSSIHKAFLSADGLASVHFQAGCIGVLTVATAVLWKGFGPKKLKFLPATLVGVVVGTVATLIGGLTIKQISMQGGLTEAIRLPTPAVFQSVWDWSLLTAALTLAVVASAETLLCATAVDRMHRGPRTQYDRELASQGVGNILCGFLGLLPMTGVIVRSAANIEAGAKTRMSAILHGAWLLVFAVALPFVLELLPIAALAGILVYTGWKLVNIQAIRSLWQYGKSEVAIYAATVFGIVAFDLLKGVLIGIGLSVAKLLYTYSHLSIRLRDEERPERTVMHLEGAATFIGLPKLAEALERIPSSTELHVHFEGLSYIDHACLDLLMNWEKQHRDQGGRLVIDWDGLTARFQARPGSVEAAPYGNGRPQRELVGVGAGDSEARVRRP